jgi:hypothetical protein
LNSHGFHPNHVAYHDFLKHEYSHQKTFLTSLVYALILCVDCYHGEILNHVLLNQLMTTSCISQQTTDDDIWKDLGLHPSTMDKKNDHIQKSSRKREYEVENNGTWPKCNRIIPPQVNGTVENDAQ